MKITTDQIRKLRDETGAPVMRVKKVLEEVGNERKAAKILKKEGFEKVAKRSTYQTDQGVIKAYVHHSGKIVGVVELLCETDFVARNELFQTLAYDLAMQAASMGEKGFEKQQFIKDPSKKVGELIRELIAKTGENVKVGRVYKIELGK